MGCSCCAPPPPSARIASEIFFCSDPSSASVIVGVIAATGAGIWNCQVPVSVNGSRVTVTVGGHVIVAPPPSTHERLYSVIGCGYAAPLTESFHATRSLPVRRETAAWLEAPYWVGVRTKKRA